MPTAHRREDGVVITTYETNGILFEVHWYADGTTLMFRDKQPTEWAFHFKVWHVLETLYKDFLKTEAEENLEDSDAEEHETRFGCLRTTSYWG